MRQLLDRVAGRVRLMVGRCILEAINPGTRMQSVQIQVRAGEVREKVEHFQAYGYSSVPHPGAEGISVAVAGSSDHQVVICFDDRRFRLTSLVEGEVALYTDEGDTLIFKRGNHVELTAATSVKLITPLTTITGDLHVMGNQTNAGTLDVTGAMHGSGNLSIGAQITAVGDVTAEGISGAHHTHMEQGDGQPTSGPM